MLNGEEERFSPWYDVEKDNVFDDEEELLSCCIDDVTVLRMAYCSVRNLSLKMVKVDPLHEDFTVSSICNRVFRIIVVESVGLIPGCGYRIGNRQSTEALQCLMNMGRTKHNTHVGGRQVSSFSKGN